ncbi:MAG: DUF2442 domain-containing protein [Armatimonadota bacterium]|nr:DUF2442 domain-containing protein [Armatimonadota bacterium]
MRCVRSAEYVDGYRVRLVFEDGSIRIADLATYLDGGIFEPLKDVEYFRTFRVNSEIDTIVWDNGADMSPHFLYEIGIPGAESTSAA